MIYTKYVLHYKDLNMKTSFGEIVYGFVSTN